MHQRMFLIGLLAFGLLALPGAGAHANYETDDGLYRITVGWQGEPVYLFQATGLDLIIRDAETGEEVPGVNATLTATLIAPGGEELSQDLRVQHGSEGRYQFVDGFVLTQSGLYQLRLEGDINGSPVDESYDMAHATMPRSDIMFPDSDLDDLDALNARITELEAKVQQLEAGGIGTNGDAGEGDDTMNNEAPALPALLVLLVGVLLVALRRRR